MTAIRTLAALGATLLLGACVAEPPSTPAAMIYPGATKTADAFQQDQAICQRHAVAQTGYGVASPPASSAPANPAPASLAQPTTDPGFMQCMAARGDAVQMLPTASPYAYGTPYAYPYPGYDPYDYPWAYPGYDFALGGVGLFGGYGFYHRGFYHHGGFHHGGFHNGFHGGFHGGGFHGGGFHGGGHR